MVEVRLKRESGYKLIASNADGKIAVLDGPPAIGGEGDGLRPMEMVLMGLAGCSSFDLLSILEKQRQTVDDLEIVVNGNRADSVPAVYTDIHIHYILKGKIDELKLRKALELAVDKYCSVAEMLNKTAKITWDFELL